MKNLPFTLFCFLVFGVHGQQKINRDPQNIVDPTGFMRILTLPVKVEGTANMFEDWQQGDVYLSESKIASEAIFNYDIMNHMISVLVEGKEYSLNPVAVDSIKIKNSSQTLINSIVLDGITSDLMLLKVYDSQHLSLYRKTLVEVIKPNYNELLNVGSRNFQIDKDYFYLLWERRKANLQNCRAGKRS